MTPVRLSYALAACLAASGLLPAAVIDLPNGQHLEAQAVASGIFHVRLYSEHSTDSLLDRYGVVRSDWPRVESTTRSDGELSILHTADAELSVSRKNGAITLRDAMAGCCARA